MPPKCYQQLQEAIHKTSGNKRCTLTLALSYSSRWEIIEATRKIGEKVKQGILNPEDINEEVFQDS